MTTPDPTTTAGARALERLGTDLIGWLTTTNPDGGPQSSPIWFLWAADEIKIYSWVRAPRNENIRERPRVAFNLDTEDRGDSYATMEGIARFDPDAPPASTDAAFMAKYGSMINGYGWTPGYYDVNYPFVIRIEPTRWRVG
jgi:PPOX class probable F420-dependent enzyme